MQPGTNVEDPWIDPFEVVKVKLHIVYIRKEKKIQCVKRKFIKKIKLHSVNKEKQDSCKKSLDIESNLAVSFQKSLNELCVGWNASYEGKKLVNTCSIDNFITLISLHFDSILSTLHYLHVDIEGKLDEFLSLIRQKKFDELRFWVSKELNIASNNGIFDFYGSEFAFVTLMRHMSLNNNRYDSTYQCWNCFGSFSHWTDLSSLTKFNTSCQTSIDSKLLARMCILCKQESETIEKLDGGFHKLCPFLILETGHLENSSSIETMIETNLSIRNKDNLVVYKLLGYTLLSGGHFTLKAYIDNSLYYYDGMTDNIQEKISLATRYNSPITAKVNFIIYLLDTTH